MTFPPVFSPFYLFGGVRQGGIEKRAKPKSSSLLDEEKWGFTARDGKRGGFPFLQVVISRSISLFGKFEGFLKGFPKDLLKTLPCIR